MQYFQTSYKTIQRLARSGRYEDVAGFLVLARHATGEAHGDFGPYRLSGAGSNIIQSKARIGPEKARGVLHRLETAGIIRSASPEARKLFAHARWEIVQGELDLALPHAFVDRPKPPKEGPTSILGRLGGVPSTSESDVEPRELSKSMRHLDALMMMIAIYRHTDMRAYGGIAPALAHRRWSIQSRIPVPECRGVRWGAEPDEDPYAPPPATWSDNECLPHIPPDDPKFANRIRSAWTLIVTAGLIYEAVSLYDADPFTNSMARLQFSLRINDFHAGSIKKSGDPAFLRAVDGRKLGFYTPAQKGPDATEAMWVILPQDRGSLVGVWRPRFRAATPDVGAWVEQEEKAIEECLARLDKAAVAAAHDASVPSIAARPTRGAQTLAL